MQRHRCSGPENKLLMPCCILQFDLVKCMAELSKKQQLFPFEHEGKNTGMVWEMFFPVVL